MKGEILGIEDREGKWWLGTKADGTFGGESFVSAYPLRLLRPSIHASIHDY
jgi:hypothetical protein